MSEISKCERVGYREKDFQFNISDVIVLKGYWIHWCKKHKQPLAWCEKDELNKKIKELKEKLSQIKKIAEVEDE